MKKLVVIQHLEWDKTKGQVVKVVCRNCDSITNHKILASVTAHWDAEGIIDGHYRYEIVTCAGCEFISFRQMSSDSETFEMADDGESVTYIEEETLYPNRIEGRKQIDDGYLLPDDVEKIYRETHGALSAGLTIKAAIMAKLR